MKFTTTAVLLAAALGATAHPSGHAHRHAHRSLEARNDFVMNKKPLPPAPTTSEQAAPPASTSQAPPTTTSKSSAKPSPSKGSGTAKPFCNGETYQKSYAGQKRATLADIMSKGNVGTADHYGCNLMLVDEDVSDSYDYLTTFTNKGDQTQECACFNKIGADGGVNGFFNGNEALKFEVGPGEKKYLAADDNTQGGCSCGAGKLALTTWGEFADTWLEFDFNSDRNKGWSGADASCLVAAKEGMSIQGMNVCGDGTCSTINPGGTGTNAYLGGMEAEDGVGLNIPPGQVRLEVTLAYSGSN